MELSATSIHLTAGSFNEGKLKRIRCPCQSTEVADAATRTLWVASFSWMNSAGCVVFRVCFTSATPGCERVSQTGGLLLLLLPVHDMNVGQLMILVRNQHWKHYYIISSFQFVCTVLSVHLKYCIYFTSKMPPQKFSFFFKCWTKLRQPLH